MQSIPQLIPRLDAMILKEENHIEFLKKQQSSTLVDGFIALSKIELQQLKNKKEEYQKHIDNGTTK